MDSLQLFWEMVLGLAQLMRFMWPITTFVLVMLVIRVGVYIYKSRRFAKAGIAEIDKLNGKEFEQYLEVLFKKFGYQVKRTPYQGDFGADLILWQGNEKTVVQAKRYNRSVGVKAVQEAVAAKEYYQCHKALVVTNNYFSQQARLLAKANHVELWDRDTLAARLLTGKQTRDSRSATLPAAKTDEQVQLQPAMHALPTPICVTCGKQVSAKVVDYCIAHAEIFQDLTYCYEHQKEIRSMAATRKEYKL
jgi:restriction system protein